VLEDGSRRVGGTAFYSALQAARLGRRALIVTAGVPAEVEALLEPYRDELELRVEPAPVTTTLQTRGVGAERAQRLLAWAGPLPDDVVLDSEIVHLAPVARELPISLSWKGRADFVALTPQGVLRQWTGDGAEVELAPAQTAPGGEAPAPGAARTLGPWPGLVGLAAICDAVVISEQEAAGRTALMAQAAAAGTIVALTAGPGPCTIVVGDDAPVALEVPPLHEPLDDLGAGDVFAAAFFVALADGQQPLRAAAFAMAAAGVRVQGRGPQAIGRVAEIQRRMRSAA
jgi:hypothetical protein